MKERLETRIFGLTIGEMFFLIAGAVALGFISNIFFQFQTAWAFTGVCLTIFIFGQMIFTANRYVVLPELICLVACLQWVIAAKLSYLFPPSFPLYRMWVPTEQYMSYAVPSIFALWLGIHLPIRTSDIGNTERRIAPKPFSRQEYLFRAGLIVIGFVMRFISHDLPANLNFLYYILSELRFVGVFSLMFNGAKGWKIWAGIVYLELLIQTSAAGVFYELILWSGYWFVSYAYLKKWRWKLALYLIPAFWAMTILNQVKVEYRYEVWHHELQTSQRLKLLGNLMLNKIHRDKNQRYAVNTEEGESLVRYNQGWIISRVMRIVPELEPYAGGKTVWEGFINSLVPRMFAPNKTLASSTKMFNQYTNLDIHEGTSMALGVAGELYANFGRIGGVLATFIYGLFIGCMFSGFARLAKKSSLWWAWAPFVLLATIEAEWNMGDIMNHTVKSLMVMCVIIFLIPVFRRRLITHLGES